MSLPKFQLADPEGWAKCVAANDDPYGSGVIRFAAKWANLMEQRLGGDLKVADVAKVTSHEADDEGITGFMYGCAVSILSKAWAHGDELRRWHNLDTQMGTEGERANETGKVLNPAILVCGE